MDNTAARTPEGIHAGPGHVLAPDGLDRLLTDIAENSVRVVPVGIRQETTDAREGTTRKREELSEVDWDTRTIRSRGPRHCARDTAVLRRTAPSHPFRAAEK